MNSIKLEDLTCGEEDSVWWISLGFKSDLEEFDVLHIVLGKTAEAYDIERGVEGIYLERFDQAYSCYNGLKLLIIKPCTIEIEFTEKGQEALNFPQEVAFDLANVVEEFKGAKKIIDCMLNTKRAKKISYSGCA